MVLTDSHAHLSYIAEELGAPVLESVLAAYAEAWAAAERGGAPGPLLLDPGVDPGDLAARLELLGRGGGLPPFLRLAAGIWPSASSLSAPAASLEALAAAIEAAGHGGFRPAAIGEGGLDYHHMDGSREAQAELFEGQLSLASRLGLPMIVHSRDAAADTLSLVLAARPPCPVVIHCFGYGSEEARAFLDAGCWISFAGNLTYKGSVAQREACALVPPDRLLLETDAPYMNPMPRRGKPATPLDVERTYALTAELRRVTLEELAETVTGNARALFGK
jgi:TatD DNase family protein